MRTISLRCPDHGAAKQQLYDRFMLGYVKLSQVKLGLGKKDACHASLGQEITSLGQDPGMNPMVLPRLGYAVILTRLPLPDSGHPHSGAEVRSGGEAEDLTSRALQRTRLHRPIET